MRRSLYRPDIRQILLSVNEQVSEDVLLTKFKQFASLVEIEQMLAIDSRRYLPGDLLVKMERMSMANSLEVRSPFLDQEVLALAAHLPEHLKRKGRNGKIILRKAFSDLIPQPITTRPKKGFKIPLGSWFRTELKEIIHDLLLSADPSNSVFLNTRPWPK